MPIMSGNRHKMIRRKIPSQTTLWFKSSKKIQKASRDRLSLNVNWMLSLKMIRSAGLQDVVLFIAITNNKEWTKRELSPKLGGARAGQAGIREKV